MALYTVHGQSHGQFLALVCAMMPVTFNISLRPRGIELRYKREFAAIHAALQRISF
jgi:hypothetical protein